MPGRSATGHLRLAAGLAAALLTAALALTALALLAGALLPGSAQLAFYASAGSRGAVYLHDFERKVTVPLYRTSSQVMTLSWSPDARRLAFVTLDDGIYHLRALDMDSRSTRLFTDVTASAHQPRWSPDGAQLAFLSQGPGSATLYLLDTAAGTAVPALSGVALGLSWSSDSAYLTVGLLAGSELPPGLYTLAAACAGADGCAPTRIAGTTASDQMPSWSPDGARLAFLSQRTGSWQVYTLAAACAGVRADCEAAAQRLTFEPGIASATQLQWSPDSRWLAFEGWPSGVGAAVYTLDTLCPDCAGALQQTGPQDAVFAPAWSPDGRWLVYVARRQAVSSLDVLDVRCLRAGADCAVSTQHIVRPNEVLWFPAWRPAAAGG